MDMSFPPQHHQKQTGQQYMSLSKLILNYNMFSEAVISPFLILNFYIVLLIIIVYLVLLIYVITY